MNTHKTAVARIKPSVPARWIARHFKLKNPMLDFGCGKGKDAQYFMCDKYDSWYYPEFPRRKYNTIVCIYVLNTLEEPQQLKVIEQIKELLLPTGVAYLAVRNDKKNLNGYTSRGTYQCEVKLDLPVLVKNSRFKVYLLEKNEFNWLETLL